VGTARAEGIGIVRQIEALAGAACLRDMNVSALFMAGDGPLAARLKAKGVTVQVMTWQGARDLFGLVSFMRRLRAAKPDIIHQHFGGWPLRVAARLVSRAPIILHLHGRDTETRPNGRLVQTTIFTDAVVAVSAAIARDSRDPRAVVIANGVEAGEPSPPSDTVAHFITAGRLVPVRAVDVMIQALKLEPRAYLSIIGDGPERERLHALVDELGLGDRVTFLGWLEDIRPKLRKANVYISTSREDGFGLAVAEAMAEGLPVIATRVGGIPELVEQDHTGILVECGDVTAIAQTMGALIDDPGLAIKFGQAARARIGDLYSVDRFASAMAVIYHRLIPGLRSCA
jgi:glycosyltransferase involved in cell wall biosynthesis